MKKILPALLLCVACGGGEPTEENPDLEACEHLEEGPFEEVAAGASADDTAPAIADDHTSYTVTLPGFVQFAADEAGDFVFYLDADVDVALTDSSGGAVAAEESATSSEACGTIQGKHTYDLEVGTYFVELSGTGTVNVVVEHGGHEH